MLRDMRHEWDLAFVESGEKALEILNESAFDIVVSDMRMPGMDGCRLLTSVQELYPNGTRIILSGYSDSCPTLGFSPLTAVYMGNALAHGRDTGGSKESTDLLDLDYLSEQGLFERVSSWEIAYMKYTQHGTNDG
jgi:hypothetical protein